MTLIKSISGIRGTIGGKPLENLTPLDVVKFTAAYATWMMENSDEDDFTVVLGRDARVSGQMLASIVASTFQGMGINVIDLGLATTPTVELAIVHLHANGGIILTASHNPAQWNALKLLNESGEFLSDVDGRKILELAENDDYTFISYDNNDEKHSLDFMITYFCMFLILIYKTLGMMKTLHSDTYIEG